MVHLPLVLPPVVVGYFLLVVLGTKGPIGGWLLETFGLRLIFTRWGAAVAAAVVSFPFMVRAIRLALEAVDRGIEFAARTLGASRFDVFLHVTLPLMLPGIISGCIVAFAASLGDFGATITFVGNVQGETQTLSLAIYSLTQTPDGDRGGARLVMISLTLALVALFACRVAGATRSPLHGSQRDRPWLTGHLQALQIDVGQAARPVRLSLRSRSCRWPGLTALFGPSGAGKSTLINLIAGLHRPDEGRVAVGDRPSFSTQPARTELPVHERALGMVFQDARLFPHMTARQNLMFGLKRARARGLKPMASFDAVVELLGLAATLEPRPHTLSGGETSTGRDRSCAARAAAAYC